MSWATVQSSLKFYDGSQSWGSLFPAIAPVSLTDQITISGLLYDLYTNSGAAAAALEAAAAHGDVRIGDSGSEPGFSYSNDNVVAFNLATIDSYYYFNDHGRWVKEIPSLTIIHEIIHIAYAISIDLPSYTESYLNATSNQQGPVLDIQNNIASEMSYTNNIQVSYPASLVINQNFSAITPGHDYTNGHEIDIARIGDDSDNMLDHSSHTTELRDLFFGFGGNDLINAGDGDDYAYGGTGDDTISGGDGNDVLYGEDGNDVLDGGDGDDTIFGGTGDDAISGGEGNDVLYGEDGDDVLDGGDGDDTIFGGSGTNTIDGGAGSDVIFGGTGANVIDGGAGLDVISLVLAASGQTIGIDAVSVTIAGGSDIVASIESVLGSGYADTFNIDPTGLAGLYASLGGNDVINISSSGSCQYLYIAPGEGADTLNVSYDRNADGYTNLLLIGGDSDDRILLNGLRPQDILNMCDSIMSDTYIHRIDYINEYGAAAVTWDASIFAVTDENVPGWIRYDMGVWDCTLVPKGEGFEVQQDTTSYLSVAIYGFESGDYGLPDLVAAPSAISNTILHLQLAAVSDAGEDYWNFPDEAAHAALSSSMVWDSLFV